MPKKLICFVISPIGEPGSETRRNADDLLDLIIRPALDIFDFEVVRGDHHSEANQIDIDVIKSVQDAALCIADISLPNANVFYEVGRRDETGKPIILLKQRGAGVLPVDIASRRYIEFDLDDRHGIRDAMQQLRNFVAPLVEEGLDRSSSAATLSDIASILQRVERKVDRLSTATSTASAPATLDPSTAISNPKETFELARKQNNVALMEACLDSLSVMMDKWKYLDYYVEIAAARGSNKAGNLLIENASEFFDQSTLTYKQKTEYLSYMVSYINKSDREAELCEMVEELASRLLAAQDGQPLRQVATVHNQLHRLYYGMYCANKDDADLWDKAIRELKEAINLCPDHPSFCYNLAYCYSKMDESYLDEAVENITKAIALDLAHGSEDDDHLELAYKLYRRVNDPRQSDVIERLRKVNPVRAQLLQSN